MKLLGFEITRKKSLPAGATYSTPSGSGGWWPLVREGFTGAWQRNIEIRTENVLTFSAVYACVTLIASDIAKLRVKLVEQDTHGIWNEVDRNSPFWPVLRKPNHYQTRIKFYERWMLSKLIHGNTYILKERDQRGVVTSLYVLDPTRVRVLVAPDSSLYYSLQYDNLSAKVGAESIVPASEIIHDLMPTLYHDLLGVSPISACGLAAVQGLRVQENSANFFGNGSTPGGVLTAPGVINEETAKRLKDNWESEFSGQNAGRIAVLGDGLKYEQMAMSAVDAQLIEQLKWTAENVCMAYHVPAYMIGVGPPPTYTNIEALNQQYYAQCLMTHFESIELLLDEGLGLDQQERRTLGTEFELDDLLRMDTPSRVKSAAEAIGSGGVAPNEARSRWLDLPPVVGGETPYLQQQNFSLAALAKRDAQTDPFGTTAPPAKQIAAPEPEAEPPADDEQRFMASLRKELGLVRAA